MIPCVAAWTTQAWHGSVGPFIKSVPQGACVYLPAELRLEAPLSTWGLQCENKIA